MKKIIAIQSNNLKTINPLTDTSLQWAIEAQKRGFKVTGSDLVITDELKELKKLGAKVQIGHDLGLLRMLIWLLLHLQYLREILSFHMPRNQD